MKKLFHLSAILIVVAVLAIGAQASTTRITTETTKASPPSITATAVQDANANDDLTANNSSTASKDAAATMNTSSANDARDTGTLVALNNNSIRPPNIDNVMATTDGEKIALNATANTKVERIDLLVIRRASESLIVSNSSNNTTDNTDNTGATEHQNTTYHVRV